MKEIVKAILKKVFIALLIISLIPVPGFLKDGGSVVYEAILYKVWDVHWYTMDEEKEAKGIKYDEGIIIEILGFEVFNNVK